MKIQFLVQIKGTVYHWNHAGDAFQVGRSLDCELPLTGPECAIVSGRHARFEIQNSGVIVWDLASKNGTYLNSRRIHTPQRLTVGDVVSLGESGPKLTLMEVDGPTTPNQSPKPISAASSSNIGSMTPQPQAPAATPIVEHPRTATEQVGSNPMLSGAPAFSANPPSPTRLLLHSVMHKQKRMWWIIGGLVVLLAICFAVILMLASSATNEGQPDGMRNTDLFPNAIKSTAWVVMPTKHGTGAVIDAKNRLIVTNYHIVGENKYANCVFPEFRDRKLINNSDYYRSSRKYSGKVLYRNAKVDLALIQLEEALPDRVYALPLAADSPEVGAEIFLIGANPKGSGKGLWIFRDGKVGSVVENEMKYGDNKTIQATMVLSHIPVSDGDSGSAIVNRSGNLVGITFGSHSEEKLKSYHIDVTEVRDFLKDAGFDK